MSTEQTRQFVSILANMEISARQIHDSLIWQLNFCNILLEIGKNSGVEKITVLFNYLAQIKMSPQQIYSLLATTKYSAISQISLGMPTPELFLQTLLDFLKIANPKGLVLRHLVTTEIHSQNSLLFHYTAHSNNKLTLLILDAYLQANPKADDLYKLLVSYGSEGTTVFHHICRRLDKVALQKILSWFDKHAPDYLTQARIEALFSTKNALDKTPLSDTIRKTHFTALQPATMFQDCLNTLKSRLSTKQICSVLELANMPKNLEPIWQIDKFMMYHEYLKSYLCFLKVTKVPSQYFNNVFSYGDYTKLNRHYENFLDAASPEALQILVCSLFSQLSAQQLFNVLSLRDNLGMTLLHRIFKKDDLKAYDYIIKICSQTNVPRFKFARLLGLLDSSNDTVLVTGAFNASAKCLSRTLELNLTNSIWNTLLTKQNIRGRNLFHLFVLKDSDTGITNFSAKLDKDNRLNIFSQKDDKSFTVFDYGLWKLGPVSHAIYSIEFPVTLVDSIDNENHPIFFSNIYNRMKRVIDFRDTRLLSLFLTQASQHLSTETYGTLYYPSSHLGKFFKRPYVIKSNPELLKMYQEFHPSKLDAIRKQSTQPRIKRSLTDYYLPSGNRPKEEPQAQEIHDPFQSFNQSPRTLLKQSLLHDCPPPSDDEVEEITQKLKTAKC